ncbi:MAG: hypothetical protein IPJ06_03980 [Saprospiraceae bacterium]|nr:hypothetical protein [Saprospiraceae bacterium]
MATLSPLTELWLNWFGNVPPPKRLQTLDKWLKPRLWAECGYFAPWLWGNVRTKGSLVYRVVLNQETKSSQCSCSARDQPCVHAIALLQGWQDQSIPVPKATSLPEWIPTRLDANRKAVSPKSTASPGLVTGARIQEMAQGYAFLETWLKDQVRLGWKLALETSPDTLEEVAARLVNDRLPGPARLVRSLHAQPGVELPVSEIRRTIVRLFLASRAMRHRDQLTPEEWANLLLFSGITVRKDTLINEAPVEDQWQILHLEELEAEADLRSRLTWMYGFHTRRYALLLDFAWKKTPLPPPLQPGGTWHGACHFYPGGNQVRTVLGEGRSIAFQSCAYPGADGWREALQALNRNQAADPLRSEYPAMVQGLRIRKTGKEYHLLDHANQTYPLALTETGFRALLIRESREGLHLFGVFRNGVFQPKSIINGGVVSKLAC